MMTTKRKLKSGLQRHVEDVFEAPLEELLARWYSEGKSARGIARVLAERGIDVTAQCIRLWSRQCGGRIGWIFTSKEP